MTANYVLFTLIPLRFALCGVPPESQSFVILHRNRATAPNPTPLYWSVWDLSVTAHIYPSFLGSRNTSRPYNRM